MEVLKIIILACQISGTTCDLAKIRIQENQCQETLTDCFVRMRRAYDNDKDAIAHCLKLKREIGF